MRDIYYTRIFIIYIIILYIYYIYSEKKIFDERMIQVVEKEREKS